MKHINSYKIFEEKLPSVIINKKEVKEICDPLINHNLIDDLKYLALDYLDNGYELCLDIDYNHGFSLRSLVRYYFAHQAYKTRDYDEHWFSITDMSSHYPSKEELTKLHWQYRFALIKNGDYMKKNGGYHTDVSNKLLKDICRYYPDEIIEIYEVDNF